MWVSIWYSYTVTFTKTIFRYLMHVFRKNICRVINCIQTVSMGEQLWVQQQGDRPTKKWHNRYTYMDNTPQVTNDKKKYIYILEQHNNLLFSDTQNKQGFSDAIRACRDEVVTAGDPKDSRNGPTLCVCERGLAAAAAAASAADPPLATTRLGFRYRSQHP